MNKLMLIVQREFTTRVKKKSFIVLTILMPFIFAAIVIVPVWLASIEDDGQKTVALYDRTARYAADFKGDASYRFVPVSDPDNPAYYSDTTRYEAVIAITDDLARNPKAVVIYSPKEVPAGLLSYVRSVLSERVRRDKLAATGIAQLDKIIEDVQTEVTVPTMKRNAEGEASSSSTDIAIAAGFLLTILIYTFVLSYGGMVMNSVVEEKTNRIVELMVSSVKPFHLMMGKIVGVSLVGFVQLGIWIVMTIALISGATALFGVDPAAMQQASQAGGGAVAADMAAVAAAQGETGLMAAILNLPFLEMVVLFVLYFIGGYLLYASFFAAVGASVNEAEDSSQFMLPVVIIMLFGFYAALFSVENTDGPLAFWTSLFPLTSPVVMMVRIPFSVPLWQEILSLVILYATAFFSVWVSARIYRVGILMYGKKPTVKEMIKWMKFK